MTEEELKDAIMNPGKYVLVLKTELDELLRLDSELNKVVLELRKSVTWLTNERERLIKENEELIVGCDELIENSKKLMAMHDETLEENAVLAKALESFIGKKPSGGGGKQVN